MNKTNLHKLNILEVTKPRTTPQQVKNLFLFLKLFASHIPLEHFFSYS